MTPKPTRQTNSEFVVSGIPVPEPISAGGNPNSGSGPEFVREMPVGLYWSYVRKYLWHIVTFVLVVTIATVLYALSIPKLYDSTVVIRVAPAGAQVVAGNNDSRQASVSIDTLLSTAEQMVQSPAVVLKTIDHLQLQDDARILSAAARQGLGPAAIRDATLQHVTNAINASHPPMTLLLQVHYRASDPDLAAQVTNDLAQSFLDLEFQSHLEALRSSSKYMSSQLDDLKAEMERSQQALVDYQAQNDVLDSGDKSNIYQVQLNQTNEDLGKAQSYRMDLESEYESVRQGGLSAVLATPQGSSLLQLQQRVQQDRAKLAGMSLLYGSKNPMLVQQQELVAADAQLLQAGAEQVQTELSSAYTAAVTRESLINRQLNQEKLALDGFNSRAVRFEALKGEATSSASLYYDLLQRIKEANVAAEFRSDDVSIVNPARPERVPVYPHPKLIGLLGFLLAGLLGVGAAIVAGTMDKTIGSMDQLEQWLKVPVAGTLPLADTKSAPLLPNDFSPMRLAGNADESLTLATPFREAILSLRSFLLFSAGESCGRLAVTSALPHEGKSTVSAHLAAALAGSGSPTLLIDADLRRPTAHRLLQVPNGPGLAAALRGTANWEDCVLPVKGIANFHILTAGRRTGSPSELLLHGLPTLLDQLQDRFSHVVLDCPPVMGFADAGVICNVAEGTLLVAHAGETNRDVLHSALLQLRRARAVVLGLVLNRVGKESGSYYHYQYYDKYYSSDSEIEEGEED